MELRRIMIICRPSTSFEVAGARRVFESSGGFPIVSSENGKASTTLPGKVEKVINSHPSSGEPEKAQIAVEGADHLYREIRVPNRLVDENGKKVKLKQGAEVDVKIEATTDATHHLPSPEESDPNGKRAS